MSGYKDTKIQTQMVNTNGQVAAHNMDATCSSLVNYGLKRNKYSYPSEFPNITKIKPYNNTNNNAAANPVKHSRLKTITTNKKSKRNKTSKKFKRNINNTTQRKKSDKLDTLLLPNRLRSLRNNSKSKTFGFKNKTFGNKTNLKSKSKKIRPLRAKTAKSGSVGEYRYK